MKFEECLEEGSTVRVSLDENMIKSLRNMAEDRLKYLKTQKINELNCNFLLEDYYSALIEIIHSIALKRGYKILNHLCVTAFMRDVLNKSKIAEEFDRFRKIRNNLVYYGRKIGYSTARERIEEINLVIEIVREIT